MHAGSRTIQIHEIGASGDAWLDGSSIAARVAGVSYEPGGTFRITTEHGEAEASIRRTRGTAGMRRDGNGIVLEIPRGLHGAELERAVVEQLGAARTELETGKARGSGQPATGDSEAHWQQALTQLVDGHVPPVDLLPNTQGNRDGLRRLAEIEADTTIPPVVRAEFMREFAIRLRTMDRPVDDLFKVLNGIVYSDEGRAKYLRKGTKIPDVAYVRDTLGGLRRLIALRALCQRGILSPEFYERANKVNDQLDNPKLPEYDKLSWPNGAQQVVELIKSGAIDFDPERDLLPSTMIQGRNPGDSGWFFAGADADVSDVRAAQSQLAIGGAYLDGYVVVDLPFDKALADPTTGYEGASRPTALDLTLDPSGKLNPDQSEPVGRTDPQAPGQVPAREVVLPPLPL